MAGLFLRNAATQTLFDQVSGINPWGTACMDRYVYFGQVKVSLCKYVDSNGLSREEPIHATW